MTNSSPIRIWPRRQSLAPSIIAKNIIVVTISAKHPSIASTVEVVCPATVWSCIDSSTTSNLGWRILTDLRLVGSRRRDGRVAVVAQAVGSCSGIRGSQGQVSKLEGGGVSLVADAAAHDQVAEVHHFAVYGVFPGQALSNLVGPFEPNGSVRRFKVGVNGETVR